MLMGKLIMNYNINSVRINVIGMFAGYPMNMVEFANVLMRLEYDNVINYAYSVFGIQEVSFLDSKLLWFLVG